MRTLTDKNGTKWFFDETKVIACSIDYKESFNYNNNIPILSSVKYDQEVDEIILLCRNRNSYNVKYGIKYRLSFDRYSRQIIVLDELYEFPDSVNTTCIRILSKTYDRLSSDVRLQSVSVLQ
tara:strand:- start:202 stop:567 length:366 start_codon:yes stop_codon:yes gene_type:complete